MLWSGTRCRCRSAGAAHARQGARSRPPRRAGSPLQTARARRLKSGLNGPPSAPKQPGEASHLARGCRLHIASLRCGLTSTSTGAFHMSARRRPFVHPGVPDCARCPVELQVRHRFARTGAERSDLPVRHALENAAIASFALLTWRITVFSVAA